MDFLEVEEIKIGEQYGQWTVEECLREAGGRWCSMWSCRCRCGRKRMLSDYMLTRYKRKDTKLDYENGCRFCEDSYFDGHPILAQGNKRNSMYNRWIGIRNRCTKPKNDHYKNYGGRGITICKEWENDFMAFYNYVTQLDHYGEPERSLDRIDNDDGYKPGNVRWATAKEQANNTRKQKNKRKEIT